QYMKNSSCCGWDTDKFLRPSAGSRARAFSPCETHLQAEVIRVVAAGATNRASNGVMDDVEQKGIVRRDRPGTAQFAVRARVATRSTRRPSHRNARKYVDGIGSCLAPLPGDGSGHVDRRRRVKRHRRSDVNEIR